MNVIDQPQPDWLSARDLDILAMAPMVREYFRQERELAIARAELEHYRASMAEIADMAGDYVSLPGDRLRARLGDIWLHGNVCLNAVTDYRIPTNREDER